MRLPPLTRRAFLLSLGAAGGAAAAYGAMETLGLLPAPGPRVAPPAPLPAHGARVLVLGGGLAGLACASELTRLGHACRVLEAQPRPGGRCLTLRRGDVVAEAGGPDQAVGFDSGLYLNAGPARIPQTHITLDYCRALGVAIEAFGNGEAFGNIDLPAYHSRPPATRPVVRPAELSYTSELLLKAASDDDLDAALTPGDRTCLRDYFGDAQFAALAQGEPPGEEFAASRRLLMFQMVGGNDALAVALARSLGPALTLGAQVRELRQTDRGVRAVWADASGRTHTETAEYAVCALPLPLLSRLPADLSPTLMRAVADVPQASTCKVGLQFRRRFWEEDDRLYSGITRTDQTITQIFYPSTGYLSAKGVLVGAYNFHARADALAALPPPERLLLALREGARIHPQYPKEYENGVSLAWLRMPWALGGWAMLSAARRREVGPLLSRPDGRIHFAGDHCSPLTGWMAGALQSARETAAAVHARAAESASREGGRAA